MEATVKRESYSMIYFKSVWKFLIKEALKHRKIFDGSHVNMLGMELPHDVSNISPNLLSQRVVKKNMRSTVSTFGGPTIGTTFIHLIWNLSSPSIDHQCLMKDWPAKGNFFFSPIFVLDHVPPRVGCRWNWVFSFFYNGLEKGVALNESTKKHLKLRFRCALHNCIHSNSWWPPLEFCPMRLKDLVGANLN